MQIGNAPYFRIRSGEADVRPDAYDTRAVVGNYTRRAILTNRRGPLVEAALPNPVAKRHPSAERDRSGWAVPQQLVSQRGSFAPSLVLLYQR